MPSLQSVASQSVSSQPIQGALRFSSARKESAPQSLSQEKTGALPPTATKTAGSVTDSVIASNSSVKPQSHPLLKILRTLILGPNQKENGPNKPNAGQKLFKLPAQILNKLIQGTSLVLSLLSMGALFFIPGINLLTPTGILLAMGVLALNEGVALVADKRGVKTLHSSAVISEAMTKPGEWAIDKGMGLLPSWMFGDLKGAAKEQSRASLLEKNRVFSHTLAKSLEHTPMFADVSQDLRTRKSVAGKSWVLLRSVGGLLPSVLMAKFLPGKKGAMINMLMYNIFGTRIHQDPEALIKKKPSVTPPSGAKQSTGQQEKKPSGETKIKG